MTDDLERRLREELTRRAEQAPRDPALAEQIISTARTQGYSPQRRRGWSTWTLPIIAAAGVAAIVTGVFVGVAQLRDSADRPGPVVSAGNSHRPSPSVTSPPPTTSPSPSTDAASPQTTQPTTNAVPHNSVGLNNFAASDLTFYGTSDGWALGTADCLAGSGRCPAMVHTTDAGAHWTSMPQPPGDTGEILGVRFATDLIGYAYGPSRLEMTVNGGKSWTTQSDGAAALETLDGNVVRVYDPTGNRADVRVETAKVGSANWTSARLPFGQAAPTAVATYLIARGKGGDVYVLGRYNAQTSGTSVLFASTDNGASWTNRGEPCRSVGRSGTIDSVAVAASPGGVVTALCRPRVAGAGSAFMVVSSDAGVRFTATVGTLPQGVVEQVAGDPRTVLAVAGDPSYRSTDGGGSWQRISGVAGTATFVGFESTTLGRIVTDDGRLIWTTTDAGAHWSAFTFPS